MRQFSEQAFTFSCDGAQLVGITHLPEHSSGVGVLVITGGPQYRVGSHRQFVLLGRRLASEGIPAMRFDYRGMGDSGGNPVDFENCEPDIRSAIDAFFKKAPGLQQVVLWGLCDAASVAMMYAAGDARVRGLVVLNPWVRTEAGKAQTLLKHYYVRRLLSTEFWRDLVGGKLAVGKALRSLTRNVRQASSAPTESNSESMKPYIERMREGFEAFDGKTLLIMSGDDLTAAEFRGLVKSSKPWRRLLARERCVSREIQDANHTFSSAEWRSQVESWTCDWIRLLC